MFEEGAAGTIGDTLSLVKLSTSPLVSPLIECVSVFCPPYQGRTSVAVDDAVVGGCVIVGIGRRW